MKHLGKVCGCCACKWRYILQAFFMAMTREANKKGMNTKMNIRNSKGYQDPTAFKAIYGQKSEQKEKADQNRFKGASNKAAGGYFERLIQVSCGKYEKDGLAVIEKTPEPMRPVSNLGGGKFIAYFEKMAQPDFKGVLRGGRAIAFEAKHTEKDRIGYERVTAEQNTRLTDYETAGAICFVIVGMQMKRFFMVPWMVWKDMKNIYGRKYMKEDELAFFEIKIKGGYLDFLEGVKKNES